MDILQRFSHEADGRLTRSDALVLFLKDEMNSGRLAPGSTFPTIQELSEATGLTFRQARCVVERLVREGYLRSRPRIGSVVLPRDGRVIRGRVLFALPEVDVSSYHAMQIARAVRSRLGEEGWLLSLVTFPLDQRASLQYLKEELANMPDLVIAMYAPAHVRECFKEARAKCVYLYGERPEGEEGRWLRFSAEEAIAAFVTHCVRAGAKRVTQVRFRGNETPDAQKALAEAGIASQMMTIARHEELGRYEGIERSAYETFINLPLEKFPDVLLFWDDFVAQGALTAFLKRGIRVPTDIKVVTLSNKGLGPVYPDSLTRIECDAAATGLKTAGFALSILEKKRVSAPPVISPQYIFGRTFPY